MIDINKITVVTTIVIAIVIATVLVILVSNYIFSNSENFKYIDYGEISGPGSEYKSVYLDGYALGSPAKIGGPKIAKSGQISTFLSEYELGFESKESRRGHRASAAGKGPKKLSFMGIGNDTGKIKYPGSQTVPSKHALDSHVDGTVDGHGSTDADAAPSGSSLWGIANGGSKKDSEQFCKQHGAELASISDLQGAVGNFRDTCKFGRGHLSGWTWTSDPDSGGWLYRTPIAGNFQNEKCVKAFDDHAAPAIANKLSAIIGNNWTTYNDKLETAGMDSGVPIAAPEGAWATSARKPYGNTHTRNWLSNDDEAGFVACKGGHPPSSGIITD